MLFTPSSAKADLEDIVWALVCRFIGEPGGSHRQTKFCRKLQDGHAPLPAASIGLRTFLLTLGVAECAREASWASLDPLGRSPGAPLLLVEPRPQTPRKSAALEVW